MPCPPRNRTRNLRLRSRRSADGRAVYLLDTNIVLHSTRTADAVSTAVDSQYQIWSSRFRPANCEVTVGELWAFAQSSLWGRRRKELLDAMIAGLVVIPISDTRIHRRWAEMYSFAKANGLAIRQEHNDVWIAATASVANLKLLTTDKSAFQPLRGTQWVDVEVLDALTGKKLQ
jgi:predicted nucleic acid-binding protein